MKKIAVLFLIICIPLSFYSVYRLKISNILYILSNVNIIGLTISEKDLDELRKVLPENTPVSDEEIDRYLIENGYASEIELQKINEEHEIELKR